MSSVAPLLKRPDRRFSTGMLLQPNHRLTNPLVRGTNLRPLSAVSCCSVRHTTIMRSRWKPIRINPEAIRIRSRGYLPHWEVPGAIYSITTRLRDALPVHIAKRLRRSHIECLELVRDSDQLTAVRRAELEYEYALEIDAILDRGYGECILADPRIAGLVMDTIHHFAAKDRYSLQAACVMPNHLHLVLRPLGDWTLPSIVHSIKRHTSREANKILCRSRNNWQREYHDRIVRDAGDLDRTVSYVLENPAKAGLDPDWPWIWPRAGAG